MNANDTINRLMAIESEIKDHENSLVELRKEGHGLFAEFESWRLGLTFAPSAAPKGAAPKTDARKDDVGLKLSVKRAIQKTKDGGSPKDVALTVADATARRFVEKKGLSLPSWVADWTEKFVGKVYPQPQVETPVLEANDTKEVEP